MLDSKFKGKQSEQDHQQTLVELIDRFSEYMRVNRGYNTYRNTNSALNHLKAFLKIKKNLKASPDHIDQDLYDNFRIYLISLRQKNNTVVKHLTRFRVFTNWLNERGYTLSTIKYELKENDIEVIVLSEKEIDLLRDFELEDQRLIKVRDVFLFGCFTGMRYGDILALQKTDVFESDLRFLIQKKGNTTNHSIPILPDTRRILDKYKDYPGSQALPCMSNQKMNQHLKELMRTVGIDEEVTVAEKSGNGQINRLVKKKWELITCHTSRKTFTTMALSRGMGEAIIKEITGHSKNSKAFAKYYAVSDELKQKEMMKVFNS